VLTPWFSSINTWNGTSIDSTDCIYILIVLYLYIQHDGYICPSIGINKFKRWKRQWKASPVFFLRFHPLSPYSSMFQLQGETGETYESKVHVILMQISNWKQNPGQSENPVGFKDSCSDRKRIGIKKGATPCSNLC